MPNEILMLIYVNVRLVEPLILSFWKFEHFLCNCRVVEDLISTFSRACLTVKFTSPDVRIELGLGLGNLIGWSALAEQTFSRDLSMGQIHVRSCVHLHMLDERSGQLLAK